ncbi:hypothetical protein [Haloarcula sp. K1]|uniref:hypothetical protein n=1 Tax=Haloarcula sp. K1 TaxID=1622207 RepID=UPI0007BC577B|nr:hypothetical protein [Haloarcula sp. K1]KZX46315.1 hypothetical protein AV929_16220 [Haloarcula sp. K1]
MVLIEEGQQFQTTFIEESAFESGFEKYVKQEHDVEVGERIEQPDSVPTTEPERCINLAKRCLLAGGNRTGFTHHTEVSASLRKCEIDRIDRSIVRTLRPSEIRFGRFRGDREEKLTKAKTVLAWASAEIDLRVLKDIEREQEERITKEWDTAVESAEKEAAARQLRSNPPKTLNGWKRFDATHDDVKTAYRGVVHGTPVIAAVYDTSEGMKAKEWLVDHWSENECSPHETPPNRHLSVGQNSDPYKTLISHLRMFDVEAANTGESFNPLRAA